MSEKEISKKNKRHSFLLVYLPLCLLISWSPGSICAIYSGGFRPSKERSQSLPTEIGGVTWAMRREGSRGLSRRSLFPIHPEGFFPSLAPSSYPVLLSAQPYLFISFFFLHGYFFFSLVHRSWKRINRNLSKDLSIDRSSFYHHLSLYLNIVHNALYGCTVEACYAIPLVQEGTSVCTPNPCRPCTYRFLQCVQTNYMVCY